MAKQRTQNNRQRGNGQGSLYQRGGKGPWYASWYEADGRRSEKSTGTTDKQKAGRILAKIVGDTALEREGLHDPRRKEARDANHKPIADHLEEYKQSLLRREDRTAKHGEETYKLSVRVADASKIERVGDITPDRVKCGVSKMRSNKRGGSVRTCNKALTAFKSFTKWLVHEHRITANPIAHVGKTRPSKEEDKPVKRRAFDEDEARRVVDEAEQHGKPYGHARISGEDRGMAYRFALGTGFRVSEILSLTPMSFNLDSAPASVFLKAEYAKNRKDTTQPIRHDLAEALRPWLADKPIDAPLFAFTHFNSAKMLRRDMAAARSRWIGEADTDETTKVRVESAFLCPTDHSDKRADFHAFRHTFVTWLIKAGVPLRIVQELARHSDPKITANIYTDLGITDTAGSLDAMPSLYAPQTPASEPLRATGTDGPIGRVGPADGDDGGDDGPGGGGGGKAHASDGDSARKGSSSRASSSSAKPRISAHDGATKTSAHGENDAEHISLQNKGETLRNKGGNVNTHDRIRTCDLRIRSPLLYPTELRGRPGHFTQTAR